MDCKQVKEIIFEKTPQTKAELPEEVQKHLENCKSCSVYFSVMQKTESFVISIGKSDAGDDFFDGVIEKINKQKAEVIPMKSRLFVKYRAVAASVLFIIAVGMGVMAGKYSAAVYSDSLSAASDETAVFIGIELADNSFDLINIEEK